MTLYRQNYGVIPSKFALYCKKQRYTVKNGSVGAHDEYLGSTPQKMSVELTQGHPIVSVDTEMTLGKKQRGINCNAI